jgi:2'-5' RNA ligase
VPAHITLLYPFKPPDAIGEPVIEKLRQCFASFRAFDFSLAKIRRFPDGVSYLAPEPGEPFRRLTLTVWDCFPETPPYGGRYSSVVPHLTLAQLGNEQQGDQAAAEFVQASRGQLPIRATVSEIALMDTLSGSWQLRTAIPLG